MLSRIITTMVGWAVAVFYEVARSGPPTPAGPVLLAANHPNALIDPLVLFRTAGRPSRPLAKAPLFEQALVGTILKGLGGLPVYRKQDDAALMHLNDRTFDAAIAALHDGGVVQIYPEGHSHSEPSLAPLRTGVARIALLAEERCAWELGLRIQPVGLTYTRKHLFRGVAVACYGEPIEVAPLRGLYERDPKAAVRTLTELVRERLERLTLNFETEEDRDLVDVAERLYVRRKKLARPRERQAMVERLPRLRRFADGMRRLRAADPERYRRLQAAVRRYLRLLTLFGAREGDVPSRYRTGRVVRYAARQLVLSVLGLPVALVGIAAWIAPFLVTRHVARLFRPRLDQVATYKLGTAILAFPAWFGVVVVGAFLSGGLRPAAIVAALMPVTGLAAIAWRNRLSVVREDVRVFLRARRRSQARDRLAEQRAALVEEFDALAAQWRAEEEESARDSEPGSEAGFPASEGGTASEVTDEAS